LVALVDRGRPGGKDKGAKIAVSVQNLAGVVEMRTYLVIMDETDEAGIALRFASRRAARTGGELQLLAIVPRQQFVAFAGVQATIEEEARARAWAPCPARSTSCRPRWTRAGWMT